jgi:hypothetical protein
MDGYSSGQGHEFFRARRVNRDRVVEVALGRAETQGNGESLQEFVAPMPIACSPTMRRSGPSVTSFTSARRRRTVMP